MIKGKEEVLINDFIEANASDVNCIACNTYNYGWKNKKFGSNYTKQPYPNIA